MSDLVKRLRGSINRPTSRVPIGNGTTVTGFAFGTFSEDDELHKQAADRIEALERKCAFLKDMWYGALLASILDRIPQGELNGYDRLFLAQQRKRLPLDVWRGRLIRERRSYRHYFTNAK